jgi:virulence-associated protein VapD
MNFPAMPNIMTRIPLAPPPNRTEMYAIAFELDLEHLQRDGGGGPSLQTAYCEVREILEDAGFVWQLGGIQFGDPKRVDAVTCVMTAQRLTRELPWFANAVRDFRLLRIAENGALESALTRAS